MPDRPHGPDAAGQPAAGQPAAGRPAADRRRVREEAERRRRLAVVFGDVLPDTTSDERPGGEPADGDSASDRWLREQVPPHHG